MPKIASLKTFRRRYATRVTFGVFKPALKRGSTLDCRYCGRSALPLAGRVRSPCW